MNVMQFIFSTCSIIGLLFDDPTFTQKNLTVEPMAAECSLIQKKNQVYRCQITVQMSDGRQQKAPEEMFKIFEPGRLVNATLGQEILWKGKRAVYAFKYADLNAPSVKMCSGHVGKVE